MQNQTSEEPLRRSRRLFSLYFLLLFGSLGVLSAYLSLQLRQNGYTSAQIGLMGTLSSLAIVFFAPRYGHTYDQSRQRRSLLIGTVVVSSLLMAFIPFMSLFGLLLLAYSIYRLTSTAMISASENTAYHVAEADGDQGNNAFGGMRLWGSLGYASFVLLGGVLFDRFGIKANMLAFALTILGLLITLLCLPSATFDLKKDEDTVQLSLNQVLKLIFKDSFLLFCVLALALTDPVMDGIRSFENIFMSDLGQPAWVIGLMSTLAALLEVPVLLRAGGWQKRLGTHKVLLYCFAFDFLRRILVFAFPNPQVLFISTVLNSVTYPFRLVSAVSLINARIPHRYTTTALAFVTVTLYGLGYTGSNLLAGQIYDRFGGASNYLLSALLLAIGIGLILWAGRYKAAEAKPANAGENRL